MYDQTQESGEVEGVIRDKTGQQAAVVVVELQ